MVLTGCASGIGRHLTGALARCGHRLIATDRDELAAPTDIHRVRLAPRGLTAEHRLV